MIRKELACNSQGLCRVAHIRPLPTDQYLDNYFQSSMFKYRQAVHAKTLPKGIKGVPEIEKYSVDEKEPLPRLLSKLIDWLSFEIDREVGNGDGRLDYQDFYRIQALLD
eukprot:gb/GECG01002418.1/.p1 GENE.gb/GECG01002418.1/~~gb/GECG01002418.1/.p1  ORF type:complete len:109 (+),score=11.47 gb/GECG01002418.1/:1-327(+)